MVVYSRLAGDIELSLSASPLKLQVTKKCKPFVSKAKRSIFFLLISFLTLAASASIAVADLEIHLEADSHRGFATPSGQSILCRPELTWINLADPGNDGVLQAFSSPCDPGIEGWAGNGSIASPYRLEFERATVDLPGGSHQTYAIWFNARDVGKSNTYKLFFSDGGLNQQSVIEIERGNLQVLYNSSRTRMQVTGLGESEWHHVVVTNDGTTTYYYLDGLEFSRLDNAPEQGGRDLYLGSDGLNQSAFEGAIGSFRAYSDGLTKAEVEQLYYSEKPKYFSAPAAGEPQIDRLLPAFSSTAGGSTITVYGYNFLNATEVQVGNQVVSFTVVDDNELTFVAPARSAGFTSVSVTNANGTDQSVGSFYYTASPTDSVVYWFDTANTDANGHKGAGIVRTSWKSLSSGDQGGLVDFAQPGTVTSGWGGVGSQSNPFGLAFEPCASASCGNGLDGKRSDQVAMPQDNAQSYVIWFTPGVTPHLKYLFFKETTKTSIRTNHNSLKVKYNGGGTYQHNLSLGEKYVLVISNDGSITRFYLNGVEFASELGSPETALPSNNARRFHLGSLYGNNFFRGCVGQFRAYSRGLTAAEVLNLKDDPVPVCGGQGVIQAECSDGIDNADQDGVADAADPGCWQIPGDPNSYDPNDDDESDGTTECQDGIDNADPEDTLADAADPGCRTDPDDPNTYVPTDNDETHTPECSDGIDNADQDGVADAADPGCWQIPGDPNSYDPNDDDESDGTTECQDGIDNADPEDTLADAADPGCRTDPNDPNTYVPTDNDETFVPECSDGIDNADQDGVADAADPGCWQIPGDPNSYDPNDNDESDGTTECQDGIDNADPEDTLADAADPGCRTDPNDPNTYVPTDNDETYVPECSDGIDNADQDGVADAADPGCWAIPGDPNSYDPNDNDESDGTTECQDGIDNADAEDTLADAADPGCRTDPNDPNTYVPTDNDETYVPECSDGIDNADQDGVADAADPGCWQIPGDPNSYDPNDNDESDGTTECQDGIDNADPEDTLADAADPGCRTDPNDPNTYVPTDNDETYVPECSDGIDNADQDGVADAADPGCWAIPGDPSSYDPNDNDESDGTTECQDGIDNADAEDTLADAADPGCRTDPNDPNTYVPTDNDETYVPECSDGIDNADQDGVADAADPGCWQIPGDPNSYDPNDNDESDGTTECQDGIDNADAEDTLADAADPGCRTDPNDPNTYVPTDNDETYVPECSDGIDNADQDGVADAADPGCWAIPGDPNSYDPNDNDESDGTTECQDGIDNADAEDTLADAADPGCRTDPNDPNTYVPTDNDETYVPECSDGIDNADQDGVADAADPGCWQIPGDPNSYDPNDNDESDGTTECQDGIDNADAEDTLADAADPGCRTDPSDPNTYVPTDNDETDIPECSDGIDNADQDGVADAADPGCWAIPGDPNSYDPNDNDESDGTTECQDGIDNADAEDTLADADDPGCRTDPSDPSTYVPTDNDETHTPECSDGIDNADQDGVADADDPGCWQDPNDPSTYDPNDNDEGDATTECQDGIDNADQDGVADAADPGCYTDPNDPNTYDPTDNDESDGTTACQDGLDNDGDGFTDHPDDPGCDSPQDDDERNNSGSSAPECDNGIDDDGDGFTDFPNDPHCDSPTDDSEAAECSDGIDNDGDGNVDFPDDTGCSSKDDDSETDPDRVCDDGLDNDGDGLIDFAPDGSGDPGCLFPEDPSEDDGDAPLMSPVYTKFNTFLAQWNFLELIVQGDEGLAIDISIFNLFGQEMIKESLVVGGDSEFDVNINELVRRACEETPSVCSEFVDLDGNGIVDTYGLVKLEFDDSNPDIRLLGRLSNYRPNEDGTFSFAFARILRNPVMGTTYAAANTYDPQGQGYLVPNWAEVIYIENGDDDAPESFTYNLYDQEGRLVFNDRFSLNALEERDLQAGHEIVDPDTGEVVEGVYMVEVIPDNPNTKYFLSVARYSSNALPGVEPETYNYAFTLEGTHGSGEELFARISNESFSCGSSTNWIEIANTMNEEVRFDLSYRDNAGGVAASMTEVAIGPRGQLHFNAGAFLAKGTVGSVQVKSDTMGAILVQSLTYVHDCEENKVQTAYVALARSRARSRQIGTINSFLGMENVISVTATTEEEVTAQMIIDIFSGGNVTKPLAIGNFGVSATSTFADQEINFPSDQYGALTVVTPDIGQALTEVYRIRTVEEDRVRADGSLEAVEVTDFYMPTIVQ